MSDESRFASPPFAAGAGGIYLTGEDNFRVTSWGSQASVVLALEGRIVDRDGCIVPLQERQTPSVNRTAVTDVFAASEGLLTNLQLRIVTGTVAYGAVAAIVELVRGKTGGIQPVGTLLQGYVTSATRLAWPGSALIALSEGAGRWRQVAGSIPAVGAEIVELVPVNARWRLYAVAFGLTTSAAVANRSPVLTITNGLATVWETGSNVLVTATQTALYRAGAGVPFFTYGTRAYHLPLPNPIPLLAGSEIKTVTGGIDGNDQYTAPQILVEEFIEQ